MDQIRFEINRKKFTVGSDVNANVSLTEFIRGRAGLKGTKYMCNEGGCGACIVTVRRGPNEVPMAVNSCMVSVLSCQNWQITTIEHIGNKNKGYHPIQKALAQYNGSQCGHCSPGWVMAMYSLRESKKNLSMLEIENSFASNVCRCTGYRPILKAFKTFADDAPKTIEDDIEDLKICKKFDGSCDVSECGASDWCIVTKSEVMSQVKKITLNDGKLWYRVEELKEVFNIFKSQAGAYMLVAGNTAKGAYPIEDYPHILIDISGLSELKGCVLDQNLIIGAGTTLSELMDIFKEISKREYFEYLNVLNDHLNLVANIPVKNLGTVAGNLMIKHRHNDFRSDLFILFETIDARLTIMFNEKSTTTVTMQEFLNLNMFGKVIINILLPPLRKDNKVVTYKIMPKSQNAIAVVHCGFLYKYSSPNNIVQAARVVYGGVSQPFIRASCLEKFLVGKQLFQNSTLQLGIKILNQELQAIDSPPQLNPTYRKQLAISLFYKSLLSLCPVDVVSSRFRSGAIKINELRPLSEGYQDYSTTPSLYPLSQPLPKLEALAQCSGEAVYTDDGPTLANEVHAAFVLSTVSTGVILSMDPSMALAQPGVIAFYTSKDIPGLNSFIFKEDPMNSANEQVLSSGTVNYFNQPIGIIVAETQFIAKKASKLVTVRYSNISKPIIDIKEAKKDPKRSKPFASIIAKDKGSDIGKVFNGNCTLQGQYHFTLETLVCVTRPTEDGFEVYSTSQLIDSVQLMISRALNIEQNRVFVQVKRLGGGFGIKITRNTQVAVACSLVSYKLNRPCRFVTPLSINTRAFGKRMPNSTDFEVAVNFNGVIQYLNLSLYEDNGFMINEKLAQLIFLSGFSNGYNGLCWNYNIYNTITDTAKNTWFRAPGTFEGVAIAETIMERISYELSIDPIKVRLANLDPTTASNSIEILNELKLKSDYNNRKIKVSKFNVENRWKKRGLRFSFLRWSHNDSRYFNVNIAVYHGDGSVTISHGGIELGQGINTKAAQICAYLLNIPLSKVNVSSSNTLNAPNSSVTGGSITTQYVCIGVKKCCAELLNRLVPVKKALPNATWEDVIHKAYEMSIDLQVHGFAGIESVVNYFVYGISVTEVEIDVLTGEHQILRVDILEDVGQSVNPELDVGQVEGAFVMGLGHWMTENLVYEKTTGELLTDRSWNYYVPQAKDIPQDFRVYFRKKSYSSQKIFGAKAVGEPPICLAISIPFAIREAITSARADSGIHSSSWFDIDGPYTLDKICLAANTKTQEFRFN